MFLPPSISPYAFHSLCIFVSRLASLLFSLRYLCLSCLWLILEKLVCISTSHCPTSSEISFIIHLPSFFFCRFCCSDVLASTSSLSISLSFYFPPWHAPSPSLSVCICLSSSLFLSLSLCICSPFLSLVLSISVSCFPFVLSVCVSYLVLSPLVLYCVVISCLVQSCSVLSCLILVCLSVCPSLVSLCLSDAR